MTRPVLSALALVLLVAAPAAGESDVRKDVQRLTGLDFSVLLSRIQRSITSTDTPYGLRISAVEPGSPAAEAGLLPGDVLLRWNGQPIRELDQIRSLILADEPGDLVELSLARRRESASIWSRRPWSEFDVSLALKAPDLRRMLGLHISYYESYRMGRSAGDGEQGRVKILVVRTDSPASRSGLVAGDILSTWNGHPVRSAFHLQHLLALTEPGSEVEIGYWKIDRDRWRFDPQRYARSQTTLRVE